MLSNKDIFKYGLLPIDGVSYVYIKNIRNDGDLVLGEKFNVLFSKEDPKNYVNTEVEVDFLSLKEGDNIGVMHDGRGGIVGLRFKNKIPEIIETLRQNDDDEFNIDKHQFLYFTTQEVMHKILIELEKAEKA